MLRLRIRRSAKAISPFVSEQELWQFYDQAIASVREAYDDLVAIAEVAQEVSRQVVQADPESEEAFARSEEFASIAGSASQAAAQLRNLL